MSASPPINLYLYSGNYGEDTISDHIVDCYLFPGRRRIRHWQWIWGTWCILLNTWMLFGCVISIARSNSIEFHYRPQQSCGKVMFLCLSVIPFRGGGSLSKKFYVKADFGQGDPRTVTCGWYASYWNTFLFSLFFVVYRAKITYVKYTPWG